MDFSLSSSLVGNAVSNPDKLALDLQFAADKTLTARRGPTPVFTRGSTGRFVGSNGLIQSAAINAPRFDHDPVTGVCKGLLVEESRTNLCVNSNLLTSVSWLPTATTVVTDAAGPDGTTAYEVSETTANSAHSLVNSGANTSTPSTVITTGVAYTQSIFLKKSVGSVDWVQLTFTGAAFVAGQYANFNLNTGAVGNLSGVTSRIEQFPNGWYRCSITATATASITNGNAVIIQFTNNTNTTVRGLSYAGSTANKILVAMGQLEAGAFPTSYIPTTTGALTRSADVCTITGSAFSGFYNNSAGTLISQSMIANLVGSNRGILQIDNGDNVHYLRNVYDAGFKSIIRANDAQTTLVNSTGTASVTQKIGIAYEGTSFDSVINGGSVISATRTMPIGLNSMRIGSLFGPFILSGHISRVSYYKKRLSASKLQAITV